MLQLVDAEDPIVADLLLGTVELILQSGGWVHPAARFVERSGQLSVHLASDDDGPLLRIPREAFVRVDAVTWDHGVDRLDILALPDDIGDVELPMLYLQTALHNQCGKLPWLRVTHPALADLSDALIEAVRLVEPGFRATTMSATDVLFSNRCFRLPLDDGASPTRVLVPLIDLLNHHPSGATAQWDGDNFSIMPNRPFDTSECALDYGLQRDAVEMAVVYGFVDNFVTWAHSAPLDIEVEGVGRVIVSRDHRRSDGALEPLRVEHALHATRINRLTFSSSHSTTDELLASSNWTRDQAEAVLGAARDANRHLLETLVETAHRNGRDVGALLSRAAEHSVSQL